MRKLKRKRYISSNGWVETRNLASTIEESQRRNTKQIERNTCGTSPPNGDNDGALYMLRYDGGCH